MQHPATQQPETAHTPLLSSQRHGWKSLVVEQFQHPPGEAQCLYSHEHTISLSLAPRPVPLMQIQAGKTFRGLYSKGDLSLTPTQVPFFARWDHDDHYLQIRIAAQLLQHVARETVSPDPDRLELLPEFRTRDPHIESIGLLLLSELQHDNDGSTLYVESLTNVLAVHLLRHYATSKQNLPIYDGGLPTRQLCQVLDYIHDYLDQDIKLATLAALLDMSQFHFSRLFKQSIGVAPYQYLLQQRVERAKQLLKTTNQSVTEIAFSCGFNSHSHLNKQFRQLTGMTPTRFRAN